MVIGDQGQFESNDKTTGQGKAGGDEGLFVRVQSEAGTSKGVFSGGSSMAKSLLGNVEISGGEEQGRTRPDAAQLAQDQPRVRPDAQDQGRTRPGAGQQAQGEREVLNYNDGSKLRISSNFPDGHDRITRVTEPDGLVHNYRYEQVNGQVICTGADDPNSRPPVRSSLNKQTGAWTIEAGGQKFDVAGSLTVDAQGVHRFREPNGNVFTRNPNGEAWYENSRGNRLPHPMEHGTKQRPVKQQPQQVDPLQPPPVRRKM